MCRDSGRQHSAAARLRSSLLRLAKPRLLRMRGICNWNTPSPNRSAVTAVTSWGSKLCETCVTIADNCSSVKKALK